jgi:hypothetical protein
MLRDLVIAISLANVFFIKWWLRLLDVEEPYHAQAWPSPVQYPAMILNVLGLGVAFWAAVTLARRARSPLPLRIAQLVFLLVFLIVFPYQFMWISRLTDFHLFSREWVSLGQAASEFGPLLFQLFWIALVALIIYRWRQIAVTYISILLLMASPVALLAFVRATASWVSPHSPLEEVPRAELLDTETPRVVWIVLDEFDQRVGFDARPAGIRMPALDRLREEALYATDAHPPAGATLRSLPALTTGRFVVHADRIRANEMLLTFGDAEGNSEETEAWSETPSIFSRVRELGGDSALVGIYHPYCRVLGAQLVDCVSKPFGLGPRLDRSTSLSEAMMLQLCRVVRIYPILHRCQASAQRVELGRSHRILMERALEQVRDPRFDLVFLHFALPHLPGVWDRHTHTMTDSMTSNYFDNLELADRVVADIRSALEEAEMWDATTFIVTSDHGLRYEKMWRHKLIWTAEEEESILGSEFDFRVPLFVKFPGQSSGYELTEPVNGVVLHDLVVAVASGQIESASEGIAWMIEASGFGVSPYLEGD